MKPFDYLAPESVDAALVAMRDAPEGTHWIAGGTDLIPQIRAGVVLPPLVIDLRHLPMRDIRLEGDAIHIGACVTHAQVIESKLLEEHLPALVEACREMAGPPVRNRGTLGGNLATASPAADCAPSLLVYDAQLMLRKAGNERNIALHDFFTGPRETLRDPIELLTEIQVPVPPDRSGATFIKMGTRRAMAVSVVSVAVRIALEKTGGVSEARIALGSVAPTPLRALKAEAGLVGHHLDKAAIAAAADSASAAANPIDDLRASASYRSKIVRVLTRRALETVWRSLEDSS
jgi:carbon-monoxide dehydrogenase medium subunit